MTEPQKIIDSIEQDIQRMRIDEALKASLVSRLDELRKLQCHQSSHGCSGSPLSTSVQPKP